MATAALRNASLGGSLGRLKVTNHPRCTRTSREPCRRGLNAKCHGSACTRIGLLPPHHFPREGDWAELSRNAYIFHGPTVNGEAGGTGQQDKKIAAMRLAGLWVEPSARAQRFNVPAVRADTADLVACQRLK
jgi:hypothetical protein